MTGFFLFHDILPKEGLPSAPVALLQFLGLLSYPLIWLIDRKKTPEERRSLSRPRFLMLAIPAALLTLVGWALYTWGDGSPSTWRTIGSEITWSAFPYGVALFFLGFIADSLPMFAGATVAWTGFFTSLWWMTWPFHAEIKRAVKASKPAPRPPSPRVPDPLPEVDVRSAQDACERCHAAASDGALGEPLRRIGNSPDGSMVLYQCRACHSFWLRDPKSTRAVSIMRARELFPDSVIA